MNIWYDIIKKIYPYLCAILFVAIYIFIMVIFNQDFIQYVKEVDIDDHYKTSFIIFVIFFITITISNIILVILVTKKLIFKIIKTARDVVNDVDNSYEILP